MEKRGADKPIEVGGDSEIPPQDTEKQQIQPVKTTNPSELEKEINKYRLDNREILTKILENISPLDEIKVLNAINAYNSLSIEAKTQLKQLKTWLDELLKQIQKLSEDSIGKEITKYKNDNRHIFSGLTNNVLNVNFINIYNISAVKNALNGYNNLTIEAKLKLIEKKTF